MALWLASYPDGSWKQPSQGRSQRGGHHKGRFHNGLSQPWLQARLARHGYVDAGADADPGLTVRGLLRVDGTAPYLQHSLGQNGWRSMWDLESQVGF